MSCFLHRRVHLHLRMFHIQPHSITKACPCPGALEYFSRGHVSFYLFLHFLDPVTLMPYLRQGEGVSEGLRGRVVAFTKSSLEIDLWPLHPRVKRNHLRNPTEVGFV